MVHHNWKTGHTCYVERVKSEFRGGGCWLDAGGGHQIFPDDYDDEKSLVEQSKTVVICDYDLDSLRRHFSCTNRLRCDLSRVPLKSDLFDFITCTMVVEHLSDPLPVVQELARILKPGGTLIIHTVNLHGHATQIARLSKVIPAGLRKKLIAAVTRRQEEDIFPTFYRFNTAKIIRSMLNEAGLEIAEIDYQPAAMLFSSLPIVGHLECYWVNFLLKFHFLRPFLAQLLVVATKPGSPNPSETALAT